MRQLIILLLLSFSPAVHAQWMIQDAHTSADLHGVDYVGHGIAWASGSGGTILRTEDSGSNWQVCTIPPDAEHLDFRGVQGFDSNTAIIMSSGRGDLSRLYKTTDGCRTWKLLFTDPDKEGFWKALSINAPNRDALGRPLDHSHAWGYILGDPVGGVFSIFSTEDGGETWSRRVATKRGPKGEGCKIDSFEAENNEAVLSASNQSLIALDGVYLLFVTGGTKARLAYNDLFFLDGSLCHESTHFLKLPMSNGTESSGAFAAAAASDYRDRSNRPDILVIVGGDYKRPNIGPGTAVSVSKVGVPLFQSVKAAHTPPHGYRSAVADDKTHNTWIAVGPNGTDVSSDNGRNWRSLKPSPPDPADADQHWNGLSLPFVVGPNGRIGKLEDTALGQ
jgi:hypothetical protein